MMETTVEKVQKAMQSDFRVLVVGVGSIGLRHLRCFKNTGRTQLSVCETDAALRSRVAAEYQIDRSYGDLDSALADRHDAVVIATPAPMHIPMAIRAAEVGLHLLIEKPLSTSEEGIDRLREIVQRRNLVAAVAYVYRANPALLAMREAILSGRFGQPVELVAVAGQNFPTYRPAYRETYYRSRQSGGGAIQDALTHVFNAAEWLVGPIDRLAADAANQVLDGVAVEDTVHVLARHNSVLGSYSMNQHQSPNEMSITVVCQRGTVRFEGHLNRWRWMAGADEPWHDEAEPELERDMLFIRQAGAFLDALEGKSAPLCTLDEGIQTLRVNLATLASVDQRTWQVIGKNSH